MFSSKGEVGALLRRRRRSTTARQNHQPLGQQLCHYEVLDKGVQAALFYGICSLSLAFLNKAVISSFDFNFPYTIMAIQMTCSVIFLQIFSKLGKINIPAFTWKAAKGYVLLSLTYGFHSLFSLMTLRGMSIPVYTAVKRCTPLVNLILAVVVLHKPLPSCGIILAVHTTVAGCFIAVYRDLWFDPYTYILGALCVCTQGIYLTLVQKVSEKNVSTFEILQFSSYILLGPFFIASVLANEPQKIVTHQYITDPSFLLILSILAIAGVVLNYSLFLCTSMNTALTTSLVGVAKGALQTFIGFFVFGGMKSDVWILTGLFVNFMGAIAYAYVKHKEGKLKPEQSSITTKEEIKGKCSDDEIEVYNNLLKG